MALGQPLEPLVICVQMAVESISFVSGERMGQVIVMARKVRRERMTLLAVSRYSGVCWKWGTQVQPTLYTQRVRFVKKML